MSYAIYIPTYRRVDHQYTARVIPKGYWSDRTFLVCPPDEAESLEKQGFQVITGAPEPIHNKRQWIIENHDVGSYGAGALFLDDDLKFNRRRTDIPTRLREVDGDSDISDMLGLVGFAFEAAPVVGIAARLFANVDTNPFRTNYRLYRAWGVNVETAQENGWHLNRVPVMEDFDLLLQALTQGFNTVTVNSFTQDEVRGANAPGGISSLGGRREKHEVAADFLENTYPGIVKKVVKDTWDNMPARVDVQVQWKKAAQRGREYREVFGLEPSPVLDPTDPLLGTV